MSDLAMAASAVATAASAASQTVAIGPDKIIDWSLSIGSIPLAVFGYTYGAFVSVISRPPPHPSIIDFLKGFCLLIAIVLFIIVALAAYTTFNRYNDNLSVWILVGCLGVVVLGSAWLVYEM